MRFDKTVISKQTQQPPEPAPERDPGVGTDQLVKAESRRLTARPEAADSPEEQFLARSANNRDDPFKCLPEIYDPEANFIVDSAHGESRDLLNPEDKKLSQWLE